MRNMKSNTLLDAKQALEELDVNKLLNAYSEYAVFEDIPANLRHTDKTELRAYFEKLFSLPGVAFSDIRIFEGKEFAALEWVWSGLKPDTGKHFSIRGASVIEMRNGKIESESIYYDRS